MTARITLLALAGTLTAAVAATPAAADDFGISFHYSRHSPRCHSTRVPGGYAASIPGRYATSAASCYTTCVPREYVYYDYDYCYDPAIYASCLTPGVAVYDDCCPAYRTTYTRSRCYTRPVRHTRLKVHYRSGHRIHHYRKHVTCRHHYSQPRSSVRVYRRPTSSHAYRSGLRQHPTSWRYGHSSSHNRHHRPSTRVRIHRR